MTLLAEAYQTVGEPEAGLRVLDEALALVEKTEERFWEAEIYRLKGKLLLEVEGAGRSRSAAEGCRLQSPPKDAFSQRLRLRGSRSASR